MKKEPYYCLLDHTADLGVEIKGTSPVDLFENAGRVMMHLLIKGKTENQKDKINVSITGDDPVDLLNRWLSEILYLFEGEGLIATSFRIHELSCNKLEAMLNTEIFDPAIHEIIREIKAVTYHKMEITEKMGVWTARVIFDL